MKPDPKDFRYWYQVVNVTGEVASVTTDKIIFSRKFRGPEWLEMVFDTRKNVIVGSFLANFIPKKDRDPKLQAVVDQHLSGAKSCPKKTKKPVSKATTKTATLSVVSKSK